MTDRSDDPLPAEVQDTLRQMEHDVPLEVQARLAQARREAVDLADQQDSGGARGWLPIAMVGGGSVAGAVLLVMMLSSGPGPALPLMEEVEMAAAQDVDMLTDLEFLAWMAENDTLTVEPVEEWIEDAVDQEAFQG